MQPAPLYQKIRNMRRGMFLVCMTLLIGSVVAQKASAAESAVMLDEALLAKGYTLRSVNGTAALALVPGSVAQPVSMMLIPAAGTFPDQQGLTRVSDIWTVDVVRRDGAVPEPLKLGKPLRVGLTAWSPSVFRKRIFFFDRNVQAWKPLRTAWDDRTGMFSAALPLPYAQVAVFEDARAVEGKGSWFRHRLSDTAASNDFPIGSVLKVTDLDTSKSVTVTVRSRGPFVSGRVIDITKAAFQKLRSTREGIARLRVELAS